MGRAPARQGAGPAQARQRVGAVAAATSFRDGQALLPSRLPGRMRRLAALLACAAACTGDPSAPHLARGNVLVNNGKRAEAAAEYREAARLAPKSSLPVERLGDVLYDLGRKDEALAAYREAAARDPGAFTARIGAARVLTALGRLSDARDELTIALRGQPTNLYLLLSRGNLYQRSGDPKAALRDYEAAVHLESRNVPALFQYGAALLEDGQLEEAGRTFDRLVEVAPDAPEGWFGRALWSARRGDRGRAAEGLAAANQRVEAAGRRGSRRELLTRCVDHRPQSPTRALPAKPRAGSARAPSIERQVPEIGMCSDVAHPLRTPLNDRIDTAGGRRLASLGSSGTMRGWACLSSRANRVNRRRPATPRPILRRPTRPPARAARSTTPGRRPTRRGLSGSREEGQAPRNPLCRPRRPAPGRPPSARLPRRGPVRLPGLALQHLERRQAVGPRLPRPQPPGRARRLRRPRRDPPRRVLRRFLRGRKRRLPGRRGRPLRRVPLVRGRCRRLRRRRVRRDRAGPGRRRLRHDLPPLQDRALPRRRKLAPRPCPLERYPRPPDLHRSRLAPRRRLRSHGPRAVQATPSQGSRRFAPQRRSRLSHRASGRDRPRDPRLPERQRPGWSALQRHLCRVESPHPLQPPRRPAPARLPRQALAHPLL